MKKAGFTLLETMIAMIIMSAGVILLAQSWSASYGRTAKAKISNDVTALLERKMVEIDTEYRGKPLDSIPEEKSDDFGSEYPQYSWTLKSKEFEVPDLAASLTARQGGAQEMLMMVIKQLTEHLKKTIKEVKVTVIYKGGKKPVEYSVTTYFVDYSKEIPLGVPGGG